MYGKSHRDLDSVILIKLSHGPSSRNVARDLQMFESYIIRLRNDRLAHIAPSHGSSL